MYVPSSLIDLDEMLSTDLDFWVIEVGRIYSNIRISPQVDGQEGSHRLWCFHREESCETSNRYPFASGSLTAFVALHLSP